MVRRQLLLAMTATLILVGCEIGNPGVGDRVAYPAQVMTKALDDVRYGAEDQQVLDVYTPPVPNGGALVWIHGGGWADLDGQVNTLASEEHAGMQPAVQALYRRGWTIFSVRYSGTDEAIFPKPLQDVKQAVRWIKAHAADFGVSPRSVIAMGFSAGGHLAAMLGVTAGVFEPAVPTSLAGYDSRVAAVVSFAGVLDPATFANRYGLYPGNATGVAALIGCPRTPDRWRTCNPALLEQTRVTTHDDPSDAPIYIVQGARDGIVDPDTQGRAPYESLVDTIGDDRVWLDMVDTGSSLSYAGLDPQNHSMALSYEMNMTALDDFVGRVLPAAPSKPALSRYSPLTSCRVVDSRASNPLVRLGAGNYRLQLAGRCGVPTGAAAAVLTVTAVRPTVKGSVRVTPTGSNTASASVSVAPGEVRSTSAVVPLSATGSIDISGVSGGVLIDVSGVFIAAAASHAGRFAAVGSARVYDTGGSPLAADSPVTIDATLAGVPADATAAMVAITISGTASAGNLTIAPTGSPRTTSGVIAADAAGQTRSTYAVAALRNGRLTVTLSTSANVTVDVVGWYTGNSAPASQQGLFRASRNAYA